MPHRTRRHRTCRSNKMFFFDIDLAFGYLQSERFRQQGHQMTSNRPNNAAGHQMTSNHPNIAAGHQTTSNCLSNAAGFQRSRSSSLMVLRSRRLRHETLTAEEATKNSHPRARTRVRTSAWTSPNPARQCGAMLLHWMPLPGFPSRDLYAGSAQTGAKFASQGEVYRFLVTSLNIGRKPRILVL